MNTWAASFLLVLMFAFGYWINCSHEKLQGKIHKKRESIFWGMFFAAPFVLLEFVSLFT